MKKIKYITKSIGDIANIGRGSSPRPITDRKYFDNGNIPWIKISDATNSGKYIYTTKEYVNEYGASFSRLMKPGTLIIATSGTLGFPKYLGVPGCIHDGWMYFDDIHDIEKDYLYYLLITIRPYFNSISYGAAIQNINTNLLKKTKITIPLDLNIQKRIADILSKYDDLIENNNKRIKLLEQMAENLYKEWFVRFRFPNYKKTKFIDGFPEDWEIMKLKDFGINLESGSRPKGGIDFSLTDGIPSFGAEVIKSIGEFDYNETKYVPQDYYNKMSKGKNRGNDILLYKDGAYIGKTTIFKYEFPFKNYCINEHVFFIKPNNTIYHNYLYFTLHQKEYFYLMQNLNRNAAQPGLSKEDINRIKINVPNEKIILLFNNFVEPLLKEIFTLAKQNQNLIKQRDLLLPRLMSGKLKV